VRVEEETEYVPIVGGMMTEGEVGEEVEPTMIADPATRESSVTNDLSQVAPMVLGSCPVMTA